MRNIIDLTDDNQNQFYRGLAYVMMAPFLLFCSNHQIFKLFDLFFNDNQLVKKFIIDN